MDIGTLTGSVVLVDNASGVLMKITGSVNKFVQDYSKGMSTMELVSKSSVLAIGSLATAVTGAATAITFLGSKGSVILGVENAFNRLAESAGTTGEALIGGLSAGVMHTVDSMELMQATTRLLSSGMQVTAQQMELLGATARELGKATGTDATQALNTLSTALTTGNDRALKRLGIHVNLVQAEKDFARSLGTTRDQLSQAGVLEARRSAMLQAMETHLERVGRSELTFKERLQQATVAIGNWFDELAKGVARSSAVSTAFDAIWTSLQRTFGPTSQTVLQALLRGIDSFASGVGRFAPQVIAALGTISDKLLDLGRAAGPALAQVGGIIVDTFKAVGPLITAAFGGVIDAITRLTSAATPALTNLRSVIADVVTFAVTKIQEFWQWLVDFNNRWQITSTLVTAGKAAWDLLKGAFELVKGAVEGVMAAWQAMPEWLRRITQTALEATAVMGIYAIAIDAVSAPMANLVSSIDTTINIIGNFSGTLASVKLLIGEGGFSGAVGTLTRNLGVLSDTIGLTKLAMTGYGVGLVSVMEAQVLLAGETAAMTSGQKVLHGVYLTSASTLHRFAEALGLTTAAEIAQTAATTALAGVKRVLVAAYVATIGTVIRFADAIKLTTALEYVAAAAKAVLSGAVTLLGAAYTAVTGQALAASSAITLTGVVSGTASIAVTGLGLALLALQTVLVPLATIVGAVAGLLVGQWLGKFPAVQSAVISLGEAVGILKQGSSEAFDEFQRWKEGLKPPSTTGWRAVSDEFLEFQNRLVDLGKQAGLTGDELERFVTKGIRELDAIKDNGKQALAVLDAQLQALGGAIAASEKDLQKIARGYKALEDAGAELNAQQAHIRTWFLDLPSAVGPARESFIKARDASEEFTKKLQGMRDATSDAAEGLTELDAIAKHFQTVTAAQVANAAVQDLLVPKVHQLAEAHRTLTPVMLALLDAERKRRLEALENDKALLASAGVTQGLVDQRKRLGLTEADIARQYKVSTSSLSAYLAEQERAIQVSDRLTGKIGAAEQAMIDAGRAQREMEDQRRRALGIKAGGAVSEAEEEADRLRRRRTMSATDFEIDEIQRASAARQAAFDRDHIGAEDFARRQAAFAAAEKRRTTELINAQLIDVQRLKAASIQALGDRAAASDRVYQEMIADSRNFSDVEIANARLIAIADRAAYDGRAINAEQLARVTRINLQATADVSRRTYEFMRDHSSQYSRQAIADAKRLADEQQAAVRGLQPLAERMAMGFDLMAARLEKLPGKVAAFSAAIFRVGEGIAAARAQGEDWLVSLTAGIGALGQSLARLPSLFAQVASSALLAGSAMVKAFAKGDIFGGIIAGAGLVVDLIGKIIGASRDGRNAIKDFAATFDTAAPGTGFDELHDQLLRMGPAGEQMWIKLTQNTRAGDLEGAKRVIKEIEAALESLNSDLQRYDLSWEDMVDAQRGATAAGQSLVASFERLKGAGYSADAILKGMNADLNAFIASSLQAGTKIPAAMQPIIEQLIRTGGLTEANALAMLGLADTSIPSLADITAAAERYGISLDALGPKVKQLQITELANQYVADWNILTAATDDWSVIIDAMRPKVQSLILDAIKYGSELPASMKPMIEAFIKSGQLVDENGQALTDLSKLTFAADLEHMFEQLITKLEELIDRIGGASGSLDALGRKVVEPTIKPRFDVPEEFGGQFKDVDYAAAGGRVTHEGIEPLYLATGGRVLESEEMLEPVYMAEGGRVLQSTEVIEPIYAATGAVVPFIPRGTDTVPAMLTPGETIIPAGEEAKEFIEPVYLGGERVLHSEEIIEPVYQTPNLADAQRAFGLLEVSIEDIQAELDRLAGLPVGLTTAPASQQLQDLQASGKRVRTMIEDFRTAPVVVSTDRAQQQFEDLRQPVTAVQTGIADLSAPVVVSTTAAQQQFVNLQRPVGAVQTSVEMLSSTSVRTDTTQAQQQFADLERPVLTTTASIHTLSSTPVTADTIAAQREFTALERPVVSVKRNIDILSSTPVTVDTMEAQRQFTDLDRTVLSVRNSLTTIRATISAVRLDLEQLVEEIRQVSAAFTTLGTGGVEALGRVASSAITLQGDVRMVGTEAQTAGFAVQAAGAVSAAALDGVSASARILQFEVRTVGTESVAALDAASTGARILQGEFGGARARAAEIVTELSRPVWRTWGQDFAASLRIVNGELQGILKGLQAIAVAITTMPPMPTAPKGPTVPGGSTEPPPIVIGGPTAPKGPYEPPPPYYPPRIPVPPPQQPRIPVPGGEWWRDNVRTLASNEMPTPPERAEATAITVAPTIEVNTNLEGAIIRDEQDAAQIGIALAEELRKNPLIREALGNQIVNIVNQRVS